MSVIVSKNFLGNGVSGDEANKQLFIAFLALFSLIVLAQGNLDEAAIDPDGAVDVQKQGADDVVAIKTYDIPSRVKRQNCQPTQDCYDVCTGCDCITTCVTVENGC